MQRLSAAIVEVIVREFGPNEVLARLSDPVWFQGFGSALGFDWHSSGLTTVVCGALKEGLKERQGDLGIFLAGGKGKASRKTPDEIAEAGDRFGLTIDAEGLQFASRMSAKVDNSAVQDGYQIYHHFFAFTGDGTWCVVQQGMDERTRYARRYHWLSHGLEDFVVEPHAGVCGSASQGVLNLVARESEGVRSASTKLIDDPKEVLRLLREMEDGKHLTNLTLPPHHPVPNAARLDKILFRLYDLKPGSYRDLIATRGAGPSTLRALSMVAEIVYGAKPSREDPVRYSFAHGGKDGYLKPVDRTDYDTSVAVLEQSLTQARIGRTEKLKALRRLAKWRGSGQGKRLNRDVEVE